MTEAEMILHELIIKMRGAGIPLSENILPALIVNTRAKRRLGCCYHRNGVFQIEISERLLSQENHLLLEETLAHELLHTCYGCQNHGKRWKGYAQKVSERFGYRVTRTIKCEEGAIPLRKDSAKYVLICNRCGAHIMRMRMSKSVKKPHLYRCRCGGTLSCHTVAESKAAC